MSFCDLRGNINGKRSDFDVMFELFINRATAKDVAAKQQSFLGTKAYVMFCPHIPHSKYLKSQVKYGSSASRLHWC